MTVNERVEALRTQMKKAGLSAWIINGTDPHQSEYVCDRWHARRWISGFTGSAGTVIVTMDKALIWVDSRYFVQCAAQISGSVFEMRKIDGPEASSPLDFLRQNFGKGGKVGISAETLMITADERYRQNGIDIRATDDLLDVIWTDRPSMPENPVIKMDDSLCGMSAQEKINRIREMGHQKNEGYHLISSLDDIAWILNLRGSDINDTPVFLAHLLIGPDSVRLFTPKARFRDVKPECYDVLPYDDVATVLSALKDTVIRINPERINMKMLNAISKAENVTISRGREYSTDLKAVKNPTELEGMRTAHILDGVALVNFLAMVKRNEFDFTEVSIAKALSDEREMEEDYLGPSFNTIAGFGAHGAVVHYSATEETDIPITGNGLLVLDSGGQYTCGTTDVTRTLLFGKATQEQKEDYTLVLKGHLALAGQIFPKGTTGHQIDALAHQFLWQKGMDYFHGTGHGVGYRLSVHEGPQRISSKQGTGDPVPLEAGMVISDEPGIYKEGKHGIRIENLVAVTEAMKTEFGQFLTFEVLTCCPYERDLIDKDMLTQDEIDMVDEYHRWVREMLIDMVDESSRDYLISATEPL
ncbi:MAG: aminopeptidase P family protein [bacterium]|jgi:Xaa-Pro aminopeptidase|nr:M24 family metallopeptidase [Spirochaetales bacterium]MDT3389445.1 aminopeptidase P family protein [bacterium]